MALIEINWRSPFDAFSPLAGLSWAHLLHGGDLSERARWSIIVAFPAQKIVARGAAVCVDGAAVSGDPFDVIQDIARARAVASASGHWPFQSGLVGYVGYEAAANIEPSLDLPASPFSLPDVAMGVYAAAAVFDRQRHEARVVGVNDQACAKLNAALGAALGDAPEPSSVRAPATNDQGRAKWRTASNFTRDQYLAIVDAAIERIRDGQIFQANLSQQLSAECDQNISALNLFARIASGSDAEHGALLQFEDGSVVSNSPERFFRLAPGADDRRIVVEPIKGTRPRGGSAHTDKAMADELRRDPKDRAENIMIADLMRNDLSKICKDGSISEDAICELMSLARVHHLVSKISGAVRPDVGLAAVFRALFPSGSVTGAPKVEAMKVIADAEKAGRGPYCGAIGYCDDRGGADFSVAIRTMMLVNNEFGSRATFPVGGGITLRSSPALEYEETLVKARGVQAGLGVDMGEAS